MKTVTIREVLVALTVTILPARGFAQPPGEPAAVTAPAAAATTAPTPPPAQPDWSFGGGLVYSMYEFPAGSYSLLFRGPAPAVPTVTASLERRMSPRSWLVLGVAGAVWRDRQDVPSGSSGYGRNDLRELTVTAGVRRPVTRAGAPVEVSVVVAAQGGIYDAEQRIDQRYTPATTTSTTQDLTAWFAGAQAGLAIERALTDGLSVRVASPLLQGRYSRGSVRQAGQPDAHSSSARVTATLAPTLELRLQF
jgi:hypothetical protein